MKGSTEKSIIEKLVYFLFKARYSGLYFWSDSGAAEQKARGIVVVDLMSIAVFILAAVIALMLRLYPVEALNSGEYGAYRPVIFVVLAVVLYLMSRKVDKWIQQLLSTDGSILLNLDGCSKKSTFINFVLVVLSPLITIVLFFLMLKFMTTVLY